MFGCWHPWKVDPCCRQLQKCWILEDCNPRTSPLKYGKCRCGQPRDGWFTQSSPWHLCKQQILAMVCGGPSDSKDRIGDSHSVCHTQSTVLLGFAWFPRVIRLSVPTGQVYQLHHHVTGYHRGQQLFLLWCVDCLHWELLKSDALKWGAIRRFHPNHCSWWLLLWSSDWNGCNPTWPELPSKMFFWRVTQLFKPCTLSSEKHQKLAAQAMIHWSPSHLHRVPGRFRNDWFAEKRINTIWFDHVWPHRRIETKHIGQERPPADKATGRM